MLTGATAWLIANGVAIALLVLVLAEWARTQPRIRHLVFAAAACLIVGVPLAILLTPAPVPIEWITVLHEGRGVRNIRQLYGMTVHAGAGFHYLTHWLTGNDLSTLPAVVRLNVALFVANGLVFFFLATAVLRSWLAGAVFLAGYAGNINTLHAAVSETPAMLWTTYFWLGCIAAVAFHDEAHLTARRRRLALCSLALFAALGVSMRKELLLIGAPAVALGLIKEFGGDAAVRRGARAVADLIRSILVGPLPVFLVVVAALLGVTYLIGPGHHLSYALKGIAPLNLSFLFLPYKLAMFLSVGFIVLFVLGMIYTTRRCLIFMLLPISSMVLFKVYDAATQGMLESFRYLTFITPMVLFVGLFGFRELEDWALRWAWPAWWKRPAVLLLGLTMLTVWQPLGPREIFGRRHQLPGLAANPLLLGRNQQTEVRYLLDLVERYPTCAFLTKTTWDEATFDRPRRYRWSAFGGGVRHYRERPYEDESPEEAAARLAPDASCVLFYRGLDCSLRDADGCRPEIEGRRPLEERVLENLPYSDIESYGAHRAEIVLGVYPIAAPGGAAG